MLFSIVSIYSLELHRFLSRPRNIDKRGLWGCGVPNFLTHFDHHYMNSRTELERLAKIEYCETLSQKLLLEYRLISEREKRREWAAKRLAGHEVRRTVLGLLFVIGCYTDLKRSSFSTQANAKYGSVNLLSSHPRSSKNWSTQ